MRNLETTYGLSIEKGIKMCGRSKMKHNRLCRTSSMYFIIMILKGERSVAEGYDTSFIVVI